MEHQRDEPTSPKEFGLDNVRYLDEWRAQHRPRDRQGIRGGRNRPRQARSRAHPPTRPLASGGRRQAARRAPTAARSPWTSEGLGVPALVPRRPARRSGLWTLCCLGVLAGAVAWWILAQDAPAPPSGPPAPPVLHVWAPGAGAADGALIELLAPFEESYGVRVRWDTRPAPAYELIQTLLVGRSPDVVLVDHETASRLAAMEALLPIAAGAEAAAEGGMPPPFVLPLGADTLWARSLRAAIPRRAAHPDLAQALVEYLASAPAGPTRAY